MRAETVLAIARQARQIGDERVARVREAVEQRRLADVLAADEDEDRQLQLIAFDSIAATRPSRSST
jgi:hypothetical protein